jgi:hypothetical protein
MAAIHGIKSEEYFYKLCLENKLDIRQADTWYDYEVNGERVEIKSCRLAVATGRKEEKRVCQGRYDFTKKYNREIQFQENVWVCFIINVRDSFIVQGFCKSKELNQKRYISIVNAECYHLKSFQEFINIVKSKTKGL